MAKTNMEINVTMSLWAAIKIRISGVFNNVESYQQVGDLVHIVYIKPEIINSNTGGYQPITDNLDESKPPMEE